MTGLDFFHRARNARQVVHNSMLEHCKSLPSDTSLLVREQQRVLKDAGMGPDDVAGQQSAFALAMFANTAPTLYWTIYELFSRPELLDAIRVEIAAHAVTRQVDQAGAQCGNGATARFTLDVASLKTKCPLLLSAYQETQRIRDMHANIRKVLSDTWIDNGRYLLREGNYCLIPTSILHRSTSIWGEDAAIFDPYRFMPSKRSRTAPSDFLAWGTPPFLCPARQFAATEILTVVALLAMQVDLVPTGNHGRWEENPVVTPSGIASTQKPERDVEVEVRTRTSGTGTWSLNMGESKTRVMLASG